MSEIISLKPGQKLAIEVGQMDGRPVYAEYGYDDVYSNLVHSEVSFKSRRSKTPEAQASRKICLMTRAILRGTWSTGAPIDVNTMTARLTHFVDSLSEEQKEALSWKAKRGLMSCGFST